MKLREILNMLEDDGWFVVRQRGSHRQLKHAALSWEDEKFAYLVAVPAPAVDVRPAPARVIGRPRKETGHVRLTLCGRDGLGEAIVTRRDATYRGARHAEWGDTWPPV